MASPFFNEYVYICPEGHPPLDLVNVAGLPVVKSGDEIPHGSILVSVNKSNTMPDSYDETIKWVQSATRPVKLTFRQLHTACGVKGMVDGCRRSWQGFLRVRTGPGQWTGRFYVLQENSILACYPVKDVDACTVIETVNITQATLIYGIRLQQFCPADVEGAYECCFALLTLGMERLIFRAESASAVMDWVSAFAVLFMSDELNLTSAAARANSHSSDETANVSALSDGPGVTIPGSLAIPMASSENSFCDTQIESEEKCELPMFLQNSCILQGYLWKKCGSSRDTWERRWFILSQDCRLTWFMAMPSGATEVPSGQLSLANIVLVGNSSDRLDDKGSSGLHGPSFLLVIHSGERGLHLRSLNRLQILSWQRALEAAGGLLGQPGPISLRHDTIVMQFLQDTRVQMLQEFQNNPEQVLLDPETAFSLIVGHEVGGCTKDAFRPIAGRFMLPLCDQFTADFVWDALARVSTSTSLSQPPALSFLKPKAFKLPNLFRNKTMIGPPDLATRNVTAEPLLGEERVDFDTFKQYVSALEVSTKPSEAWISLKLKLGLHPLEVLVAQEDAVLVPQLDAGMKAPILSLISHSATSYGTGIGAGYLFLTDRHLIFRVTLSQVVKVIPLDSLESVSKSELSNLGAIKSLITPDGVLNVKGVVHTISIQTRSGGGVGIEDGVAASLPDKVGGHVPSSKECPVETMSLVVGNQWHSGKFSAIDTWLEYIDELIDAHQLDVTVPGWRLTTRMGEKRRKRTKVRRTGSLWSLKEKFSLLSEEATAGVDELYVARSRLQLWTAANIIRCRALSSSIGTHVTCVMMVSRTREILNSDEEAKDAVDPQPRRYNQHLDALQSFLSDNDISKKDILSNTNEYGGNTPPINDAERSTVNPKWLYILSSFLSHAREMKLRKETEAKSFSPTRFREEWELFWDHVDPLMENIEWRNPMVSLGVMGTLVSIGVYDLVNILIPLIPTIAAFYLVYAGSVLNYNKRLVESGRTVLNRSPAKQQKKAMFFSQLGCGMTSETVSPPAHSETVGNAKAIASVMEGSSFTSERENCDNVTSASSVLIICITFWTIFEPRFSSTSTPPPPHESILGSIWRVQAQVGKLQSKLHSYNTILLKLHSLLVWADHERTKEFIVSCICMSLIMLLVPGKYIWISFVLFIFAYPIWAGTNSLPALLIEDWWRGLPLESATHANIEMARVQALHKKHD